MRTTLQLTRGLAIALVLVGLAAARSWAVSITMPATSGLAGQTVNVAINTTDLTGLNVDSYQFALTYNSSVVTATGIITTSTLTATAGWQAAYNVTSNGGIGQIKVSAAGSTALSGPGTLIIVSFLINPTLLNGSSTVLSFPSFTMNEGTPSVTTSNQSLTVNATPSFGINPASGEIVRGSTLQFSTFGSATPPITWSTTDNTIATISGTGLLTGVAPGSVQVMAVDNASLHATTTGSILVRGMGATVGITSVFQGLPVSVPITVTSLNGLGIRSGQLQIAYNPAYLTFTSFSTPGGTLLNGYGSNLGNASDGVATFAFAGATDLTGSGILCYVNFNASPAFSGNATLTLSSALFNESLPALKTSGYVSVTGLPTLSVSPFTITLYDGQTQTFTAGGGAVAPLTWSSTNPSVATIDPVTGILTAVSGGTTQVKVIDSDGATGSSGVISVYDCKVTLGAVTFPPGMVVQVPLNLDRNINTLGVTSFQYAITFSSPYITAGASPAAAGIASIWGSPAYSFAPGQLKVAAAGSKALGFGTMLTYVTLTVSPSAPNGVIPLTLTGFMFNEGHPLPFITNGSITVNSALTGIGAGDLAFALGAAQPNPARSSTRIAFVIPSSQTDARATLALYGVNGARVRTLFDGVAGAGSHVTTWDLRDDQDRAVAAGVYFARLEWAGRQLERPVTVIR